MPKRVTHVVAVVVAFLPLACGGSQATLAPTANAIEIRTFQFQPRSLAISAAAEVMWTNTDQITHTVTAGRRGQPTGMFDIDLDGAGATARFTFAETGTYPYHCEIHGAMDADIVVT